MRSSICLSEKRLTEYLIILQILQQNDYLCIHDHNTNIISHQCTKSSWFFQKDKINFEFNIKDGAAVFEKDGNISINHDSILKKLLEHSSNQVILKASNIYFSQELQIKSDANIIFTAKNNIIFEKSARFIKEGKGDLYLKSGIGSDSGSVLFKDTQNKQLIINDVGNVYIYYHPEINKDDNNYQHKYHNPYKYSKHIESTNVPIGYMLVSSIDDLQNIANFLHGSYALSKDINAYETKNWNNGNGFVPLKLDIRTQPTPFSGNFDGNDFNIQGMYINQPDGNFIGLFGLIKGHNEYKVHIKNLNLKDFYVSGNKYVGGIAGYSEDTLFSNIKITDFNVTGEEIVGGVLGSAKSIDLLGISCENIKTHSKEIHGAIAGAIKDSSLTEINDCCSLQGEQHLETCFGYANLIEA